MDSKKKPVAKKDNATGKPPAKAGATKSKSTKKVKKTDGTSTAPKKEGSVKKASGDVAPKKKKAKKDDVKIMTLDEIEALFE